jgi:signal transduction histidine kinase
LNPLLPTFVVGDPARLRQVLDILLRNAVKFTAAGKVELVVTRIRRNASGVGLRFEVRDTGIGIPEQKIGSLFSPFTQVDGSATRSYGGAGLGLSVAKRLVELMGGEIGVDSEVGKGSNFWFTVDFEVPDMDRQTELRGAVPQT